MGELHLFFEKPVKNSEDDLETEFIMQLMEEAEEAALKEPSNEEESKLKLLSFIEDFFKKNKMQEYAEWSDKMYALARENPSMMIRREDPTALVESFQKNKDLEIEFMDKGEISEPYPNAADLGSDLIGIKIAAIGGFGKVKNGAVVFMEGFIPSDDLEISRLPNDKFANFSGSERFHTKMVRGKIDKKNLKFVLLRLPRKIFPESMMTENELDSEQPHISRLFVRE